MSGSRTVILHFMPPSKKNDPLLISLLIEKGLNPDAQNNEGKTPLIKALDGSKPKFHKAK